MRVIDVVMSPEFKKQMEDCIEEIRQKRIEVGAAYFKRGPLERLQERGEYNAESLANLYLGVLDSALDSNKYSSTTRGFIKLLGDEAYKRTIIVIQCPIKTDEQNDEKDS